MEEDIKHICNEIYQGERWQLMIDFIKNNYIPKSKVREKLKELQEKEQELSDEQGYWGGTELQNRIEILQELLEEGDK